MGHPAHFHLFKNVVTNLQERGHQTRILIKNKDILEDLLKGSSMEYTNILPKGRKDSKISIALGLLIREKELFKIVLDDRPDVMIGTSAEIGHIGRLLNIPSIAVNEDDFDAVPLFSNFTYPFVNHILAPAVCRVGHWKNKTIAYEGYHELAYLSPTYFQQCEKREMSLDLSKERFFILRFAKLSAHHDAGKTGLTTGIAQNVIDLLKPHGRIYITAERALEPQFEKYRTRINPLDIHHALSHADLYLGDSQTMAAEAAVLGTPSLRFNDFVGRLGYLEELEHKYGLTYGIRTTEPRRLYEMIEKLLYTPNLQEEWQVRRSKMLADKIDVTAFMVWLIENYPDSAKIMHENPDYQFRFMNNRVSKRRSEAIMTS